MGELTLAYEAHATSTGIPARAVCSARNQFWVCDDSGSGGAAGAGEFFCASISGCAVNLVGRIAAAENRSFGWIEVRTGAYRDMDKTASDVTLYDAVRVAFELWEVREDDAEYLVKAWKQR